MARGHNQVGHVALRCHQVALLVHVVVVAVVGQHAQQRQPLLYEHVHHAVGRLVARHGVDVAVAAQRPLDGQAVHLVQRAAHGVQPRSTQQAVGLFDGDETGVQAVGYGVVHTAAHGVVTVPRKVGKGKHQIHCECH